MARLASKALGDRHRDILKQRIIPYLKEGDRLPPTSVLEATLEISGNRANIHLRRALDDLGIRVVNRGRAGRYIAKASDESSSSH